jgi:hypothetical protein
VNRFQKVVNVKATPSDDLDLPKRSQMQGAISIHELHSSSGDEEAFHGPARKTFNSSHLSIVQQIRSGLSTFIQLRSECSSRLDVNRHFGVTQRGT